MRAVVQRVRHAAVAVDGETVGSIGPGMLVLVGAVAADTPRDVSVLADKLLSMRIFSGADGKMNLSVVDTGGSVLVVSQFTLVGDVTKGRRPSFTAAARPSHAKALIDDLISQVGRRGTPVAAGVFGASMDVSLVNAGPVTFVVDVADGRIV